MQKELKSCLNAPKKGNSLLAIQIRIPIAKELTLC